MPKMYFYVEDGEYSYDLESIEDMIRCDELTEKEVFEAGRMVGEGFSWCKYHGEVIMKGEGICGKSCKEYDPRNGKSGACKKLGYCYTPIKKVLIKLTD